MSTTTEEAPITDVTIDDREDLNDALDTLAVVSEELDSEEKKQERRVRKARKRNQDTIEDLSEQKDALEDEITDFAQEHREELLEEADGKTIELASGDIQFRKGSDTVNFDDDKETIIERLKESGHEDLVTVKEKLYVSTLKEHREVVEAIKGLSWAEGTDGVIIKPL